jgi:predicted dehydrogenase
VIKAAIVGLGWWGKTLVESVENSNVICFTAGATRTVSPEVEAFAEQKSLRLVPSYHSLLSDKDIDAVVLAVPHSMHKTQVIAAAVAGKHVYCEKPFTLTKREAEDTVAAVRHAGVTLAVGYSHRFHPEMTKLRDMIRSGELGTLLHIEATMTSPNVLFVSPSHWRADKSETPLGGLMPMGVHAIDGMINLCGPIDRAFAQSFRRAAPIDADDTTSILVHMKEGMSGYLGTMTTTGPGFFFQMFGSKGWVRLEGLTPVAGSSSEEQRTRLFGTCKFQPVKGEAKIWRAASLDVSRAALEAFAKAAAGGPAYPIPLDQVIQGVAATEAVIRSARSGKVEHVQC